MEVDEWTGFTERFTHIKSGATASDKTLLLATILADAINLALTKMAESCPGTTYAKLSWLQAWHIRDEPTQRLSPTWSTHSFSIPSPKTGATAPRRRQTGSGSKPGDAPKLPAMSIRSMAANPASCSTRTFPINTRCSIRK